MLFGNEVKAILEPEKVSIIVAQAVQFLDDEQPEDEEAVDTLTGELKELLDIAKEHYKIIMRYRDTLRG